MKNHNLIIVIWVLLWICPSCGYVEGIYKDGNYAEQEVVLEKFDKIRIETSVHLILRQSFEDHALISGLDFKIEDLEFHMENLELIISSKSSAYARKDKMPTVNLPVEALSTITSNAPSEISCFNELSLNTLLVTISGRGTYTNSNLKVDCEKLSITAYGENLGKHFASGKAKKLHLTMEGLTETDTRNLIAQEVTFNQRSLKNSNVYASDRLSVKMYSSGDVFFSGNPQINYRTFDLGWEVDYGQLLQN